MPPKRPAEDFSSSKVFKKAKTKAARTIDVQQSSSQSQRSGKHVAFTADSLKGLPLTLEPEKFAEARSFEIGAMHKAMQTAREDASKRVWQTLPRHMRRRTASHDSRRVPARLREKARAEMDPVKRKKKVKALAKRGKTDIGRTARWHQRQKDKVWLETHIWHVKRMKMENRWGYRLAIHPTEKAFRPSHRAALHSSILQDVSYYGILELKGPEDLLKELLTGCCDPQAPGIHSSYTSGARACDTYIYSPGAFPYDLIAPCTILWRPGESSATFQSRPPSSSTAPPPTPHRTVWLHIHPASFLDVHQALQECACALLRNEDREIEIADLRGAVNAFEIIGPRCSQVLAGALKLTQGQPKAAWRALAQVQTPASVPRGMVIGATVWDPRLSYPPSNVKIEPKQSAAFAVPPSSDVARSAVWDEAIRDRLRKPRFKKKDLDDRRSKNLVPGTALRPSDSDDSIPILIIQRTVGTSMHGYLMLFPAGWSMPFLSSLTHTGTRVGGLREHQSQRFEAGAPHFPQDYVGTGPYDDYWGARAEADQSKWERTPKAKRVPYEVLPAAGQSSHALWSPDWEGLLSLNGSSSEEMGDPGVGVEGLVPTQTSDAMDDLLSAIVQQDDSVDISVQMGQSKAQSKDRDVERGTLSRPWLLSGAHTVDVLQTVASSGNTSIPESALLTVVNDLRAKQGLGEYRLSDAAALMGSALVSVTVRMCGRGAPGDVSIIYDLGVSDDEAAWRDEMQRLMKKKGRLNDEGSSENIPDDASSPIIGYITSGRFSLQQGKGYALGAVSLSSLVEIMRRDTRMGREKKMRNLVKVRARESAGCRLAWVEVNRL